ncbi:GAF and ANTAR domain-containing protein [Streptomyces sp. NPDC050704]|uniref:GAF and ANTAR domain-containing protein n=1 Tax=Streptomyces sp. NPDC050704 TaxID=3157219 RepID=UPI0034247EB8
MADRDDAVRRVYEAADGDPAGVPERLCEALIDVLSADAATLCLFTDTPGRQLLCASSPEALRLEELQYEASDGPCVSAATSGRAVVVGDLSSEVTPWPVFGALVREQLPHVAALFAFPLAFEGQVLGSADVLLHQPRTPTPEVVEQGLSAARAATMVLLSTYEGLTADESPPWAPSEEFDEYWSSLRQAVGVLAARLGIDTGEALARIRAYAFGSGEPLPDIADSILHGPPHQPSGPS